MGKNIMAAAGISLLLVSCATQKTWVAVGGSRADGVVTLAYDYQGLEVAQTSFEQALRTAVQSCQVWGFSGATPFGGETEQCAAPYFGGCNVWRVSRVYQCTGTAR